MSNGATAEGGRMKIGVPLILVLVLSLASWYFFYVESMPLAASETALITGFWLLVVLSGKWLLTRVRKGTEQNAKR